MSFLDDLIKKKQEEGDALASENMDNEEDLLDESDTSNQGIVLDSPKPIDQSIVQEIQNLKKQSEEDYSKAAGADRWLKLAENINKALALKDQSRMLRSVKVPGMQAMGTDLKLETGRAKDILDRRKSDIENLLSEYKLKQSLKPAGPKTMKVGDRLVSIDPITGTAKELYKPAPTEQELTDMKLATENKQLVNQQLKENIKTPAQKEMAEKQAIADLQIKQANLQNLQQEYAQNPEMSKLKQDEARAKIDRLRKSIDKDQKYIENMDKVKKPTEFEKANIGKIKAQTAYYQSKAATPPKDKELVKEEVKIRTENRKERKQIGSDIQNTQKLIKNLEETMKELQKYSKSTMFGTGPIATFGGSKKIIDNKLESLDSRFKEQNLETMGRLFQGMSKAVDSDNERRAFEAAQPSTTNDDPTNMDILSRRIEAAKSLLNKQMEKYSSFDEKGNPVQKEEVKQTKIIDGKPVEFKKTAKGWEQIL